MVFLNLLTFGLWGKLGRLTHYAFDAVLISTILAGMKRSTGLTFPFEKVQMECEANETPMRDARPSLKTSGVENNEYKKWVDKYLDVGEWVMDSAVTVAGSSGWFERRR